MTRVTTIGKLLKALSFYKWAFGDLTESDSDVGVLAEYLVGDLLNCLPPTRKENSPFDLETKSGVTIEVKATTYRQECGGNTAYYRWGVRTQSDPGLKWATLSGASALLGYCWKAPLDNQGGVQIINSWCANRSSLGDVAAWMRANDNMNGRNACAIRLLQGGKIEYRYFRRDGRGWNLRSKYLEIVEEINL